jgi:hypothetical protein
MRIDDIFFPTHKLKTVNGYDEFYHGWGAEVLMFICVCEMQVLSFIYKLYYCKASMETKKSTEVKTAAILFILNSRASTPLYQLTDITKKE